MEYQKYMKICLDLARQAFSQGEIPIGAIVVKKNKIIGKGFNQREANNTVHEHAEIVAMNEAAKHLKSWNLSGCTLFVTVEPCPMCAGALVQSQINKVVYGAREPNSGSLGTVLAMNNIPEFNHKFEVISGIMEEESVKLMKDFFKLKRNQAIKIKRSNQKLFEQNIELRIRIFVDEQKVPLDEEIDEYDDLSRDDVIHISALQDDKVVGTARYIIKDKQYRVGRVAVDRSMRGKDVGTKLLEYIEVQALNNGIETMLLGAQVSAVPFYEKSGYQTYGEVYDDAGIDHIMMSKKIKER